MNRWHICFWRRSKHVEVNRGQHTTQRGGSASADKELEARASVTTRQAIVRRMQACLAACPNVFHYFRARLTDIRHTHTHTQCSSCSATCINLAHVWSPSRRVDRLSQDNVIVCTAERPLSVPSICPCPADAGEPHTPHLGNARLLLPPFYCVAAWATKLWAPVLRTVLDARRPSLPSACLPTGPLQPAMEEKTKWTAPQWRSIQASRSRPGVSVARKGG